MTLHPWADKKPLPHGMRRVYQITAHARVLQVVKADDQGARAVAIARAGQIGRDMVEHIMHETATRQSRCFDVVEGRVTKTSLRQCIGIRHNHLP